MARVPQVMLTLAPDGTVVAEFPTPNGLRRHVPIHDITGMETIRRILAAQLSHRPQSIGSDAKPTTAQVRHWSEHLDQNKTSEYCPWCIAASMGIDTSQSAYNRAQAILRAERAATSRRSFHYAGDGSVKVYHTGAGKSRPRIKVSMAGLLDEEDEDDN